MIDTSGLANHKLAVGKGTTSYPFTSRTLPPVRGTEGSWYPEVVPVVLPIKTMAAKLVYLKRFSVSHD